MPQDKHGPNANTGQVLGAMGLPQAGRGNPFVEGNSFSAKSGMPNHYNNSAHGAPGVVKESNTNDADADREMMKDLAVNDSSVPTNAPAKSYNAINHHTFSQKYFEIQNQGLGVYWVNTTTKLFHKPQIDIHVESDKGPIVASCRLGSWSRSLRYSLGNPESTDKDSWPIAECGGWTEKAYSFNVGGGKYEWRRTRNKDLGASRWSGKSFKLVDLAGGNVLAVYVWRQGWTNRHEVARIDYFVELNQDLELASLAIVHGIEERIRQAEGSSAACGG